MTARRTIVITGGSGFIGTNLVDHFTNAGWRVRNLDIAAPRNPEHMRYWTAVDLLDRDLLTAEIAAARPKAVLHFAARTDLDERAGLSGYRANVEGVANVVQALRGVRSVERVVFASTQLVASPDGPPDGDLDYRPTTTYGRSKALGEMIVRAADVAPAWTIVRPTSIWGPWCGTPFREFFTAVARGRYVQPAGMRVTKQWGYVGNACRQIECLLSADAADVNRRTFYLSDYDVVDLHDFANRVRHALGRPPVRLVPAQLLRLGAAMGDVAQRMGWDRPPLTSFRYRNLVRNERQELEPLRRLAGVLPFSVDDGIAATVAWLGRFEPALAA